jgi:hypothetical protein
MREFSYQTTGNGTKEQIAYRNNMTQKQNALAKSGGSTVPQFRQSGVPTGTNTNDTITQMAGKQMTMDANSKYNHCVGKSGASCGGSRKKKMKSKKKYRKV